MIKLVLNLEKANRLDSKLQEEHQVDLTTRQMGEDEMLFIIPSEYEQVFLRVLNEVLEQELPLWFNTYYGNRKVYPSDLLYFEVQSGITVFVNEFYKETAILYTLAELEEMLGDLWFERINKSQIVNLKKITYIRPLLNSKIELTLTGDIKLEVNRSYLRAFKKALNEKGGV
ncbi:MAG: LytTR family transcriptional regulator [Acholeplasmataceae bacterium]|nr:LytTR family transcriptional regulator [Acholeplasmataceae bacterium]